MCCDGQVKVVRSTVTEPTLQCAWKTSGEAGKLIIQGLWDGTPGKGNSMCKVPIKQKLDPFKEQRGTVVSKSTRSWGSLETCFGEWQGENCVHSNMKMLMAF